MSVGSFRNPADISGPRGCSIQRQNPRSWRRRSAAHRGRQAAYDKNCGPEDGSIGRQRPPNNCVPAAARAARDPIRSEIIQAPRGMITIVYELTIRCAARRDGQAAAERQGADRRTLTTTVSVGHFEGDLWWSRRQLSREDFIGFNRRPPRPDARSRAHIAHDQPAPEGMSSHFTSPNTRGRLGRRAPLQSAQLLGPRRLMSASTPSRPLSLRRRRARP